MTPVNYGENYDSTTGIYTVPINGLYEFNIQIYCRLNENTCVYYITVDGTQMTDTPFPLSGTINDNDNIGLTTTVILKS